MAFSAEDALRRLTTAQQAGNLAHAYLICGAAGSEKNALANNLAALILQCKKEDLSSHSDFHVLQPISKSRRILIDQIRLLEQFIQKRPSMGSTKVAVIQEADRLAPNAANAFLKGLEEPPAGTYLILLSNQPDALLPTILSRCIQVPLRLQGKPQTHPHEHAIIDLFDRCLQADISPIAQAFQLSRGFQTLLTQYKEKSGNSEEFEAETQRYKKTTDGKWLQEREEHLKALTESNALRLRRELIAALENHLAEGLRASYRPHITPHPTVARIAQIPQKTLLRQLECLERLQRLLDRGVNESLALEVCFLEIFTL